MGRLLILSAWLLLLSAHQGDEELFWRALERDDFLAAWTLVEGMPEASTKARAKAELLLRAGDPAGARAAARSGLRATPQDLDLLFYEATAAVWVGNGALARDASNRLLSALEQLETGSADHEAWLTSARRRNEESKALIDHEQTLQRAVARSKTLSITALIAAGSTALISIRIGRSQGRSSKPVS